jgi:DNA-binding transcriptional MerR regulator
METPKEFGYFAKEVSVQLDIHPSTLRRWCLDLEKAGYEFIRNENNQRIFYDRDFKSFRKMKELINKNIGMENTVRAVVAMAQTLPQTPIVHLKTDDEIRLSKRELQEIIQEEVKKAIHEEREIMFQAFEEKLNDNIEKRDRQLLNHIRETQEVQKLVAATESKKKKWFNFFRK